MKKYYNNKAIKKRMLNKMLRKACTASFVCFQCKCSLDYIQEYIRFEGYATNVRKWIIDYVIADLTKNYDEYIKMFGNPEFESHPKYCDPILNTDEQAIEDSFNKPGWVSIMTPELKKQIMNAAKNVNKLA